MLSLELPNEHRQPAGGVSPPHGDRLSLRLADLVSQLAEKLELQVTIALQRVDQGVDVELIQHRFGDGLRGTDIETVFSEAKDVSRIEKCTKPALSTRQVLERFHHTFPDDVDRGGGRFRAIDYRARRDVNPS